MKRKAAKPNAKPRGRRTPPAPSGRARNGKAGGAALKQSKPRSRATAVRLVSEVDRLAAELEASRAHIRDLESRIDVDPLTETLNRRGFERALTRSLAYIKRYGANATVIYLDLDDFKPVNDRHGHAAGDAVLKAIAAKLAVEVRASDVVARIGGDEFVVLLWNMTDADATAKAAELERAVYTTAVRWGASTMVVGASAGVAFVGPLDTPSDVLARADAAMYARKTQRRQRHSAGRVAVMGDP